jgi:hypothetical protein
MSNQSRVLRLEQRGLGYLTELVQGYLELRRHRFPFLGLPCCRDPGPISHVHQKNLGIYVLAFRHFGASRQPHIFSRLNSVVIQWG